MPTFFRRARKSVFFEVRSNSPTVSTVFGGTGLPFFGFFSRYRFNEEGTRNNPFRCCTNVLLPLPVCPIMPKNSPSSIVRETSFKAAVAKREPAL